MASNDYKMVFEFKIIVKLSLLCAMRSSGFVKLPSERTLQDYTHYFTHRTGFQGDVDKQLASEINQLSLSDAKKFVALSFDEMKIKEGLVYNKHSGEIIGYTDFGDINDELLQLERKLKDPLPIAKYILVFMVRGIFFHLQFPFAHFTTRGITGESLYPLVWEAVRRLEALGLKVISVTSAGASPNRKFFRMHYDKKDPSTFIHKAVNPFAEDQRWLYFFPTLHIS